MAAPENMATSSSILHSTLEENLELSAGITKCMKQEFGKQVFVETRVNWHAKRDDNVHEIWLESWDIDLLHSKRQAICLTKQEFSVDSEEEEDCYELRF